MNPRRNIQRKRRRSRRNFRWWLLRASRAIADVIQRVVTTSTDRMAFNLFGITPRYWGA